MVKLLEVHGAHIAFVLIGVIAFVWAATRKPNDAAPARAERRSPSGPLPRRPAGPEIAPRAPLPVARRGLLALGPLVGALATGAILYGMNIGSAQLPGAVIWAHVGVSVLALLLVGYKVASLRRTRLRRAVTQKRLSELASIVLGALSVPLVITGVDLLIAPSSGSFGAYAHLVSSAWWSGLLLWHLRRYLGPALRAALGQPSQDPARAPAA